LADVASEISVRGVLLAAVEAGRNGHPPPEEIASAILSGDRAFGLDRLEFDSLGWMEFCIAVELSTGQELTPADIAGMTHFNEIETWLNARL
jgi:hypothetical protein